MLLADFQVNGLNPSVCPRSRRACGGCSLFPSCHWQCNRENAFNTFGNERHRAVAASRSRRECYD